MSEVQIKWLSNSSTKTGASSPNSSLSVTPPRQNKRHRYIRAVFGQKDRRFPKRDPEIEAMYPGHLFTIIAADA